MKCLLLLDDKAIKLVLVREEPELRRCAVVLFCRISPSLTPSSGTNSNMRPDNLTHSQFLFISSLLYKNTDGSYFKPI